MTKHEISPLKKPLFASRLLLFTILLVAFGCQTASQDAPTNPPIYSDATELPLLDIDEAEQVATTFLDAWTRFDYEVMYGYLTPNARDKFAPAEFVDIYSTAHDTMKIRALDYQISNLLREGPNALIGYSVQFESSLLGSFRDPADELEERTMQLVPTPEGWRIAWSRADILGGWNNDAFLTLEAVMPTRGNIYDRTGKIIADQSDRRIGLYIVKQEMRSDEATCVATLARILEREIDDVQAIFDRFRQDMLFYVDDISADTALAEDAALQATCNPRTEIIPTRYYHDKIAPHLIGYVGKIPAEQQASFLTQGYPADAIVGLEGIERAFEPYLAGSIGQRLLIRAADTGAIIRVVAEKRAEPGQSLHLTLDRDLQIAVQTLLQNAYDGAQATWARTSRGAAAVVMDIHTGEVLAIASYPDYDQSLFNPDTNIPDAETQINALKSDPRRPLVNRATQGTYPLGSVFKVFSMIAGLDTGVWPRTGVASCDGVWEGEYYGDIRRTDWYFGYGINYGALDAYRALVASCNIFFWTMSVSMNDADPFLLPNYIKRLGFGSPTPFQGVPTAAGLIPNPDWKASIPNSRPWSRSDAINLVIGQGEVGVSPLQVARAISAVANGGILYEPHIVSRVQLIGDEAVEVFEPVGVDLGIRPEVLADTRAAMCDVTTDRQLGTANYMYQDWYELNSFRIIVCGKTGTAQSGQPQSHAWFAAFAPAENPEIAVVVVVENSCEGSEVAAPIVREIIAEYYGLEHSIWPELWQTGCAAIGPD